MNKHICFNFVLVRLWSAWQIEHHNLWEKYMAERNDARSCGMEDLSFKFVVG